MTSEGFIIVQDTREQWGYGPLFRSSWETGALTTGDYSIRGYEDRIGIERKSLPDLLGSLTRGRERFIRELQRAQSYERFYVIVETSAEDLIEGRYGRYGRGCNANSIWESIIALSLRYAPFIYAGTREAGARLTESLLVRFIKDHQKATRGDMRCVQCRAG